MMRDRKTVQLDEQMMKTRAKLISDLRNTGSEIAGQQLNIIEKCLEKMFFYGYRACFYEHEKEIIREAKKKGW